MSERLLLDEMYAGTTARWLAERGHDVLAVVADAELRGAADAVVYRRAGEFGRRVVTENVRDFAALVEPRGAAVLFVDGARFRRSRRNPGPLLEALDAWLRAAAVREQVEWLTA